MPHDGRIVARVDQLMSLCDKLEAGLLRSQADSEKLMEAFVERMLARVGASKFFISQQQSFYSHGSEKIL